MILVSIDASTTSTGMAIYDDGKYLEHTLIDHHKNKDIENRINQMIKDIISYLQKWQPDIVYIEQPQGKENIKISRMIGEILGAVRMWCVLKNKEYNEIPPSVWRKWCPGFKQGGKERSGLKEESIRCANEHFDFEITDDNIADALNIGRAMLNYCSSI